MDLPKEIDDYMKETIDYSLGIPVSAHTLHLKLRATEDAYRRLLDQHLLLLDKLRLKEQLVERAKAEANMNAAAVKKFVEENQRLAGECASLVSQCNKWEKECLLYDRDREALMDFGNEADQRAKEAEFRVRELEEELECLKSQCQIKGADSSAKSKGLEQGLVDSILAAVIDKEGADISQVIMEANIEQKSCQELLKMGNSLRPSTQRVLALAAKVNRLQRDKENLTANLIKAEEEVKLLSEENNVLDLEFKRILKQQRREQNLESSGGKHLNSASNKGSKRKASSKMSSPEDMKIDCKNIDFLRQPLSPLRQNSPECRMHKK